MPLDPITRSEQFYSRIAGESGAVLEPVTRKEHFLARIAGDADAKVLEPRTRTEQFLQQIIDSGGGGGEITVEALTATENGVYTAPSGKSYSPVTVAVKDDTALNALIDRSITEVESDVTSIGRSAFRDCSSLVTIRFPNVETIANDAFTGTAIQALTEAEFPALASVNSGGFSRVASLQRVHLPNTAVGSTCFSTCIGLISAVIKEITNTLCFSGCSHLTSVDICSGNRIHNQDFQSCQILETIVLRNATLYDLANINAFTGTPFASGGSGGTIYIPKSLYDQLGTGSANDYKAATNWSVIDSYGTITWAPIEGSYFETHYADGTLIPTA